VGLLNRVADPTILVTPGKHGSERGPGSPEQVEWTHLLQRLHWTEVRPTSREQTEQEYMGFVGRTGAGPGLGWTLPLASRRRRIRRQVENKEKVERGEKIRVR